LRSALQREQEAIAALERSIAIDPTLSQAYLSLAVSHTNNSDPAATFRALEAWVDSRSRSAPGPYVGVLDRWERQSGLDRTARKGLATKAMEEWLSGALIEMVKAGVELGNDVDGDLQVALGVLFNTSGVSRRPSTLRDPSGQT
jgi:peroxin-5